MSPDLRLLAALADLLPDHHEDEAMGYPGCGHGLYEHCAAAILPAFLADPRVAEWLAERLAHLPGELNGASRLQAAAILGTVP